jgi:hypothetical protein
VIALAPYALRALALARRYVSALHATLVMIEGDLADRVYDRCCATEGLDDA